MSQLSCYFTGSSPIFEQHIALHRIESTHEEQLAEELVRRPALPSDACADNFLLETTAIVQRSGLGDACGFGISTAVNMPFAQAYVLRYGVVAKL